MFKSYYIYIYQVKMLFPDYGPVHISIYREDSLTEGLICKNVLFPRDFAELTN